VGSAVFDGDYASPSALCRKRLSVVLEHVSAAIAQFVIHPLSAPADLAGIGFQHPSTIRVAVVLPVPLTPTNPNIYASLHSTGPRSCQAFGCTIAAGLVGAVPPGEEPGVLLGS
jgi:hypothetical protein